MFPNKVESIFLAVAMVIMQMVVTFALAILGALGGFSDFLNLNPGARYIVVFIISTAILLAYSLSRSGLKFKDIFHAHFNNPVLVAMMVLIPITMVIVGFRILLSDFFIVYYTLFPHPTYITEQLSVLMGSGIMGVLCICIVAPVTEEMIYRGVILRGLLASYGKNDAIVFSAIVFSIVHINPDQIVFALVIGLFFGWLYVKTYSLWPSIIAHILFNSFSQVLSSSLIKIQGVNVFPNNQVVFPSLLMQLIALILTVTGLFVLHKLFTRPSEAAA
jgi:membrane protease YdiL (CAAX protease family)